MLKKHPSSYSSPSTQDPTIKGEPFYFRVILPNMTRRVRAYYVLHTRFTAH